MIRATTPTHQFFFDSDPSEYNRILVTYAQNGKIVLEKQKKDMSFEAIETESRGCLKQGFKAWYRLTQEETKMFLTKNGKVSIQIRVLTENGEALASEKRILALEDVLNDEVLE